MTSNQIPQITHDEWSAHIAAWRVSKLTRAQYCRQHELQLNVFLYQINRQQGALSRTLTLVPVRVAASAPSGEVVLRGPKGWSLALTTDVSAAWLGELLGALS